MDQGIINFIFGALMMLMGGIIKAVWDGIKDLQQADKELTQKVSEIELLVAGDYARKDYVECKIDAVFAKLDKIEDKLDAVRQAR